MVLLLEPALLPVDRGPPDELVTLGVLLRQVFLLLVVLRMGDLVSRFWELSGVSLSSSLKSWPVLSSENDGSSRSPEHTERVIRQPLPSRSITLRMFP